MSLNPGVDSIGGRPAAGNLILRPATPADLNLLRSWEQDPSVRDSGVDEDWQWETELHKHPTWREWLIAEVNGRPIGFIQIIDPENEESRYWGCIDAGHRAIDIWIGEPDARGKGYGTQMMEQAIERCFADPSVHTIILDPLEANARARRFYERLGFEFLVNRDFQGEQCCVYRMRRDPAAAPN